MSYDISTLLNRAISADARTWLDNARSQIQADAKHLPVAFAGLARNVGKEGLEGGRLQDGALDVDLDAWRTCDAAGLHLIQAAKASTETHVDLFLHGDSEERTIALRALACLPVSAATVTLLGEIQRTNHMVHFEAGGLDSNVVARAVRYGGPDAGFTQDDFHRFILKMAFADLPTARVFDATSCASETLSRMLQDFATEREAAGRVVWVDTFRLIGYAPASGTKGRLLGGIEHGSDPVRMASAEGLRAAQFDDVLAFVQERIEREPRDDVREALQAIHA